MVFALFVATMLVVPLLAPVPVSDDWIWTRSVEALVRDGVLRVDDIAAPTLVFQVLWGAGFVSVLGPTFGVLRLSTVVIVLLSGLALHGLCRELDISAGRSALVLAVYLFNPLAYGLTFTFMTDPHFVALLVISVYLYVRGLRPKEPSLPLVLAGSAVAGMAFLVRQQGALIPVAVVTYLLLSRRLRFDGRSARLVAAAVGVPLVAFVGYQLWLTSVNGVPRGQSLGHIKQAGLSGTARMWAKATFVAAMYVGFFVLPLALALVARLPALVRPIPGRRLLVASGWVVLVAVGAVGFAVRDRLMPYVALFLDPAGIGPKDLVGGRQALVGSGALAFLTVLTAVATAVFGLALSRPAGAAWRGPAGLVLFVMLWQLLGTLPPSGAKEIGGDPIITFDRYLLPLLPLALCVLVWALRGARFGEAGAWVITGALALFSVLGTRDLLVWQTSTWDLARELNCMGIPNHRLDAGHAWSGYHMSDGSFSPKEVPRTPRPRPYWMEQLAPLSDSGYLISTAEIPGRVPVMRVEYSQWLQREPTYLYVSRRPDVTGEKVSPAEPAGRPTTCPPARRRLRT